jgi:hypothetical protein
MDCITSSRFNLTPGESFKLNFVQLFFVRAKKWIQINFKLKDSIVWRHTNSIAPFFAWLPTKSLFKPEQFINYVSVRAGVGPAQGCQMVCFQTKNKIWEKISGPQIGKCWYSLWPFGIYYGHLVYFVSIWYIFSSFGIMHQEKCGNPGPAYLP